MCTYREACGMVYGVHWQGRLHMSTRHDTIGLELAFFGLWTVIWAYCIWIWSTGSRPDAAFHGMRGLYGESGSEGITAGEVPRILGAHTNT